MEPLLRQVSLPVLVLAGSEDHMLPSLEEAERLSSLIPSCQQVYLAHRKTHHWAVHILYTKGKFQGEGAS